VTVHSKELGGSWGNLQELKNSPNHSFFDKEIVTKMNDFKIQNNIGFGFRV
jgi:hypothetical protein